MGAFLAVIAFCVSGECAFFVSKTLTDTPEKCTANLNYMSKTLAERFGQQLSTIETCIKVPMKIA